MELDFKYCTKCRQQKPISEFRKQAITKDGYQYECKSCTSGRAKNRYDDKRDTLIQRSINWQVENGDKHKAAALKHYHSPSGKISRNFRKAFERMLGQNHESFLHLIGLTPSILVKHLTGLLKDAQTWENYGVDWRIGYIIDPSKFNLDDTAAQRECFNWKNLTPVNKKTPDEEDLV